MIAAVKANAFNDIPCQQCTDKVAGKIGSADNAYLPCGHVFLGEPKRHECI